MVGIIVYYVVGPVHPRNLQLIAREMPDWTFRVAYEPAIWWLNSENMAKVPFEKVALTDNQVPDALWSGDVRAVIFSTVQPRQGPINLLRSAMERGVPTIAIEESNQIALNNGTVNNYLLPVDHVLVASSHEEQGMIEAGVPECRVEVTGWPFYAGQIGKTPADRLRAMKEHFGLEPDRPVATLTLTALNDAGESPTVRRRQLTLAAQGLPPEYQLIVKPHPIENLDVLMPFINQYARRAKVIEGSVQIDDVLEATDILLNRGRSQVCIEALFREIPVIILDTGVQTPFHGLAQDLVVEEPGDLAPALARLSAERDPMQVYVPFREAHVPYPPQKARALTCRRIREIATRGSRDPDRAGQWFDLALYQAWQLDRRIALEILSPDRARDLDRPIDALKRLIRFQAMRVDLDALKRYVGSGFRSHVLRCLWINQLDRPHERPMDADLEWMQDFPSPINTPWFLQHVSRWVDVLLRSGHSQAAMVLAQRLDKEFAHVRGTTDLVRDVELYHAGLLGRAKYFFHRIVREARTSLRPVKRKLRKVSRSRFLL